MHRRARTAVTDDLSGDGPHAPIDKPPGVPIAITSKSQACGPAPLVYPYPRRDLRSGPLSANSRRRLVYDPLAVGRV